MKISQVVRGLGGVTRKNMSKKSPQEAITEKKVEKHCSG